MNIQEMSEDLQGADVREVINLLHLHHCHHQSTSFSSKSKMSRMQSGFSFIKIPFLIQYTTGDYNTKVSNKDT